jgi:CRP/FNR family transcriptional regulator
MLTPFQKSKIRNVFPFLSVLDKKEWAIAEPVIQVYPPKTCFFTQRDSNIYSMFLLRGTAQITFIADNGNETVFHALSEGEVCGLLTLSGLSGRDYPGSIVSMTEVEALFIRKQGFLNWILHHESIRHTIFSGILNGMMNMSDQLQKRQLESIDIRLVKTLLQRSTIQEPTIYLTHHELASEIGTAREVISRTLQKYRKKEWIETGRGWVTIKKRNSLKNCLVTKSQNNLVKPPIM